MILYSTIFHQCRLPLLRIRCTRPPARRRRSFSVPPRSLHRLFLLLARRLSSPPSAIGRNSSLPRRDPDPPMEASPPRPGSLEHILTNTTMVPTSPLIRGSLLLTTAYLPRMIALDRPFPRKVILTYKSGRFFALMGITMTSRSGPARPIYPVSYMD